VIAAKRLGAERIVLAGRHEARTDLGRDFGATDVVAERGDEGIARIRELTGGVDKVIEAVGTRQALDTALGAVLDGGTISRLGAPQYEQGPLGRAEFMRNLTLTGGAGPARAYIPELLPDVLDGTITPGRVFDETFPLDRTPDAYRAMADRQVLKALIRP
jgi:threonine dehydrogenase-like Zn-dependent dehydrogenase